MKLHGMFLSEEEHNYIAAILYEHYFSEKLDYRQIENTEYFITSDGYVFRRLKNGKLKFRKPCLRQGYLSVMLRLNEVNKWYRIHRLVCKCYHNNFDNKSFVNHKDGNKLNNHYLNLEWCTQKENIQHAFRTGLQFSVGSLRGRKGNLHPKSVPVLQYDLSGNFIREWESMNLASEEGFLHGGISKCCTGKVKQHRNYVWRYKSKKL